MSTTNASTLQAAVAAIVASSLLGCAAGRKSGEATAPSSPASEPAAAARAQQPTPPPAPAALHHQPGASNESFAPAPPPRALALGQASNDIEASQRELDVAGGDCRNACRALGSMDRAAGRLCGLVQSNDEQQRCNDAKTRVYSARAKVKDTCGTCPDVSVDRDAPIPSR